MELTKQQNRMMEALPLLESRLNPDQHRTLRCLYRKGLITRDSSDHNRIQQANN